MPINIKGKSYVLVNERIKEFRNNDRYKGYSIETELVAFDPNFCVFKAIIKDENNRVVSTGFSHEEKGASELNSTSYVENSESSAIGRALGILGIGIDGSIASAEEVENAINAQEKRSIPPMMPRRVSPAQATLDSINQTQPSPDGRPKVGDRAFIDGHNAVVRQNRTTQEIFWADEDINVKWTRKIP
jgi:hypothetical protein